ncbi:site-specific tyrosine recombinase XerD [Flammeovirga sp. EKP202]|uniref:site-specific tyrosine recombinase XerD n=1 Tax=Flammeovirga sp. EKP202 TaxID=2770592 RepID=UPI00165ED89E|nr:site-specific tyrosine recombinase XerD [Flammeovirga sp. EKP202]MBD0403466.1 site-specific tyrosine recombinase XerD [Flammeovirga sp. EKP202]
MNWKVTVKDYALYLRLERGMSKNTIEAYLRDVSKFVDYVELMDNSLKPQIVKRENIVAFLMYLEQEMHLSTRSQARILSGLKSFYTYLNESDQTENNPVELIETPRLTQKLPDTLEVEEIDLLIDAIDHTTYEGRRNHAILEVLYGCGLRVSELINLSLEDLFLAEGFIKVVGKGDKERFVPIGEEAAAQMTLYIENDRCMKTPKKGSENIIFLNRRGAKLTRVMIFTIIKRLAEAIQLGKNISPHTFRHSFASHMVEGGADLRAVQEMLGHESITTTEIYTHLNKEYLQQVITEFHPRANA